MRLLGHPMHPMLVAFPIGLLALVPLWDALALLGVTDDAAPVAYWSALAGLVGGGLAVITGLVDFVRLPPGAAVNTALVHASAALTALSLFGVAFAFRSNTAAPSTLVIVLDALGAAVLGVTGWFGGHLVFRHGAGVEPEPAKPNTAEQRGSST